MKVFLSNDVVIYVLVISVALSIVPKQTFLASNCEENRDNIDSINIPTVTYKPERSFGKDFLAGANS